MEPKLVRYECDGIVRHTHVGECSAHLELVGGRDRHSVGGQIVEGPRWWRGRIVFPEHGLLASIEAHEHLEVDLPNRRPAIGVVHDSPDGFTFVVNIKGLGPPPFDVQ